MRAAVFGAKPLPAGGLKAEPVTGADASSHRALPLQVGCETSPPRRGRRHALPEFPPGAAAG